MNISEPGVGILRCVYLSTVNRASTNGFTIQIFNYFLACLGFHSIIPSNKRSISQRLLCAVRRGLLC